MKHIVSFSGGLGSWAAAKIVADKYGTENLYLVFTDTLIEDPDLYRFLPEAAKDVGGELIWLKDGRDPWEVFWDVRYMGNTRTAHCSEALKSKPFYAWVDAVGRDESIVYLGIDWTEQHRLDNARKRRPEYNIEAPLCEPPYLEKEQIKRNLKKAGIRLPRLYRLGFAHNNCAGGCVKAGQGQWAKLFQELPETYAYFEKRQNELMAKLPTAKPFLRMSVDKKINYLTLTEFREKWLQKPKKVKQLDMFEIGGCGCFLD